MSSLHNPNFIVDMCECDDCTESLVEIKLCNCDECMNKYNGGEDSYVEIQLCNCNDCVSKRNSDIPYNFNGTEDFYSSQLCEEELIVKSEVPVRTDCIPDIVYCSCSECVQGPDKSLSVKGIDADFSDVVEIGMCSGLDGIPMPEEHSIETRSKDVHCEPVLVEVLERIDAGARLIFLDPISSWKIQLDSG